MVFGFFTYPKRLNDLFIDAVNIWLILGDEDALEIAANALMTAADKQRESMTHYTAFAIEPLKLIWESEGSIPTSVSGVQTVGLDTVKRRLVILLDKLDEIQGFGVKHLIRARMAMKRENEMAVEKGDTSFFRSRYPDFPLWVEMPATRS